MNAKNVSEPVKVEKPSDREIRVTRTFNAPARLVFAAWTQPELFKKWWVPRSMGMVLHACEMDVRVGGRYRLNYGEGMDFFGKYVEVDPPSRLAWTNEEEGAAGCITTVTFEEKGGKTVLTLSELYGSKEALEEGAGATDAMNETFAQLDELLGTL